MTLYLLWCCIRYNKKKRLIQGHNYGRKGGYSDKFWVNHGPRVWKSLKFKEYYPIAHIFVPACSNVKICHCIHPFFRNYAPVSTPSSYCIEYSVIKDTVSSYFTKYTLCTGMGGCERGHCNQRTKCIAMTWDCNLSHQHKQIVQMCRVGETARKGWMKKPPCTSPCCTKL